MSNRDLNLWSASFSPRGTRAGRGAAVLAVALSAVLTGAAAPSAWTLGAISKTTPAPSLNLPTTTGNSFSPAPTPDLDLNAPLAAPSNEAQLSPSLYKPRNYYQGEGYVPGSTVAGQQNQKFRPAPGINLKVPLQ